MNLTLATRASRLALWQANFVKEQLLQQHPALQIELLPITSEGDKILDKPLDKIGGKGLFIKALEQALQSGAADFAVHSMKDVPNEIPDDLTIAAITERADPRDVFLSVNYAHFSDLPQQATVGTCSVRRRAQLLALRPDLTILDLRGNVDTRLKKLLQGDYDAIILASAGLARLDLAEHIKGYFSFEQMLPSVAQGALGIECRRKDTQLIALLQSLNHFNTAQCVQAERAFTAHLQGDCHSPVGVHAQMSNQEIYLQGVVASRDGKKILRGEMRGTHPQELGVNLGEELLRQGAKKILEVY